MTQLATYLAALLNATIVGLSFLFTKLALEATTPTETLGYRFIIAWIFLTIYMKFFYKGARFDRSVFKDKKKLVSLIILALFYPLLFFSFQAFGLNYTTSAEGGIVMAFTPALTALFAAFFLKEKLYFGQVMFIFLSISGVLTIFFMNGVTIEATKTQLLGFFFLVISVTSLSGYTVLARYLSMSFNPMQLTYVMVTLGMIFFNAYVIIEMAMKGQLFEYFSHWGNLDFILSALFLGILSTFLTSYLSNFILTKLAASKMSIFANLSTVISILAGAIWLNEEIHAYHILGFFMIITGVLGTNFYKKERRPAIATSNKTARL
jgi:drug/metabolite transporter (DMT)-like permease